MYYMGMLEEDRTVMDLNKRLDAKAMISCLNHMPISPIIHYFEAIGTVTLSPIADLQAVKSRTMAELYAYLEKKNFCERIDKSEIEEIILSQAGVQAVSLRFVPMHDINSKTFNVETGFLGLNTLNNFVDSNPMYDGKTKHQIIREIYDIIAKWFGEENVPFSQSINLEYATDAKPFPALYKDELVRKDGPDSWPSRNAASTINEHTYWTKIAERISKIARFSSKPRFYGMLREVHGGIQRYLTNSLIDAQGNISGFSMRNEIAAIAFNRPFSLNPKLLPGDYSLQWKYGY